MDTIRDTLNTMLLVLPPTNDWVFKLLFGNERHKDNTIALLKSFLDLPSAVFFEGEAEGGF